MTSPEQIAAKLSDAQRKALLGAKVHEPHSFMPNYHAVEFKCAGNGAVVESLQDAGLVSLPIRLGDRSSTFGFSGEILPLGLEVRKLLEVEP